MTTEGAQTEDADDFFSVSGVVQPSLTLRLRGCD